MVLVKWKEFLVFTVWILEAWPHVSILNYPHIEEGCWNSDARLSLIMDKIRARTLLQI